MDESVTPYKDVSAQRHSREGGNPVCVLRQLRRCSTPARLKPRGNAATGAPFAGGVLDSRLRGNDGSIHARLADLQGQPFLPVLAPVITPRIAPQTSPQTAPQTMPENADENTMQPLQTLPGLLSEAELAAQRQSNKKDTHVNKYQAL